MIENISPDITQPEGREQERSPEIERFAVFRFEHGLGKGIKARIKSLGCSWNTLHQGWICSLEKKDEIQKAVHDARLVCSMQIVDLPKGMIPPNPKIAAKQSRLEILEEQAYKEEQQLLQDVYRYD